MITYYNEINTTKEPSGTERIYCRGPDFACKLVHIGTTMGRIKSLVFLCVSGSLCWCFIQSALSTSRLTHDWMEGTGAEFFEKLTNFLFSRNFWTVKFSYRRYVAYGMSYPFSIPCATLIYQSSWLLSVFMSLTFCPFFFLSLSCTEFSSKQRFQ